MSIKTPTFILISDYNIAMGTHDTRTLPAGSFVQPINEYYVPQHIRDEHEWTDMKTMTYAYTHYGIITIPINFIRQLP